MAKSDARFDYRASLNRESHNLGEPFGFTCAPGMLLPVFADIATPGDSYYINHDMEYLRTLPLTSPAMIDVKVHLESFFVPFQMIYQPIEQTLYSMLQPMSQMFSLNAAQWLNQNFPLMRYNVYRDDVMTNRSATVEHSDSFRIADMLGLNADAFAYDASNPSRFSYAPSFFPWQLLAYQTIFQYFYRLDDKTKFNTFGNYDGWYNQAHADGGDDLFEIHQRPWDFDYFTSMYRSPIVSDASMQRVLPAERYSDLIRGNGASTQPIDSSGNSGSSNKDTYAFTSSNASSFNGTLQQMAMSTSMIRQMFANEKLAMITGRARKTYDAQVLAHFGVNVPHDPKHDIAFIGRDTYDVKIGEVTSLASSSSAGLGDLAGKGWAAGKSQGHKFTAPCHGVVMTIFSVEPRKRYYGGFDRINALTNAFDIPTPEFDRLGNMPMFRYEAGENAGSGSVSATDIIGWKERYYYNKRRHPKVTLAFQNNRTYAQLYNNRSAYMLTSTPFGAITSTNNNTARPDLESRFYIDRNCMDGMMLQPYVGEWQEGAQGQLTSENWNKTPWLAYSRDPFIVDLDMKVKKVSWLSKDGEPIYSF